MAGMPFFLHIAAFVHSLFKSRRQLALENLALRQQLAMLKPSVKRPRESKYMARYQKPPSQTWRTFLGNHTECLAAIDFFTVPTAGFRVLYVFIVPVSLASGNNAGDFQPGHGHGNTN
jgi:hypothetical protein